MMTKSNINFLPQLTYLIHKLKYPQFTIILINFIILQQAMWWDQEYVRLDYMVEGELIWSLGCWAFAYLELDVFVWYTMQGTVDWALSLA